MTGVIILMVEEEVNGKDSDWAEVMEKEEVSRMHKVVMVKKMEGVVT